MSTTHHSTDILNILESIGVDVTKAGDREITGRCPVHARVTGHEDRSPSWSINSKTGLWLCFSCGAKGTLSSLIAELSGDNSASAQHFLIQSSYNRLLTRSEPSDKDTQIIQLNDYYGFGRVSDRLCASRNLNPDITWMHGVRWDPSDKAWIVPIVAPTGNLIGWQAKKYGWVRNRPNGVEKATTLFGVERFRSSVAVLVESPLDVVRLSGTTVPAQGLASFGAHVSDAQCVLLTHLCDTVIVAMDNDAAGMEANKRLYAALHPRHGVRWWNYAGTSAKDIGDMSDADIVRGYETSTVVPPWIGKRPQ